MCIWKVQLKPNNMDSLKILKPKMFGTLHISYPKIWVTIFIERWVSISNFQFNIVFYKLGQHSLDSKCFSFWKQFPEVLLSYFSHKFDDTEYILRYHRTEPKKFSVAEYPKYGKFMLQILLQKMAFKGSLRPQKSGIQNPCIQKWQVLPPLPRLVTNRINA